MTQLSEVLLLYPQTALNSPTATYTGGLYRLTLERDGISKNAENNLGEVSKTLRTPMFLSLTEI